MSQDNVVNNYDTLMSSANAKLNAGQFIDSADDFANATEEARSTYEKACAYQMMGVALRLDGHSTQVALIAFGIASDLSEDGEELQYRIERDGAMLFADINELLIAYQMLWSSYKGLEGLGSKTEAAISLAVLGRVVNRLGDKDEAFRLMIRADRHLRASDSRTYELNNLVWLLKLVNPLARLALLPRVIRLIRQTGQRRRLAELALLVIGGNPLYDYADRLRRRRTGS
jgi:hypothetical protein